MLVTETQSTTSINDSVAILSTESTRIKTLASSINDVRIQSCDWWIKTSGGKGNK